jgi:RimJ/RimL family protein N-acetyltransferase
MTQDLTAEALPASLTTGRLILRPPVQSDLAAVARLINDPAIAANTGAIRYPYPVSSGWHWLRKAKAARGAKCDKPYLMVLRSNPRQIAGTIGIAMRPGRAPSIGYWVAKRFRRKGFAAEAARALIAAAFTHSGVAAIQASARITNVASQKVLQSAGMRRTGRGHLKSVQLGRYVPTFTFALDRAAWEKATRARSQRRDPRQAMQIAL